MISFTQGSAHEGSASGVGIGRTILFTSKPPNFS